MNPSGWVLVGFVIGAIVKLIMPGRDSGGWIVPLLLGLAGSLMGGFLATVIRGPDRPTAGWIGAASGAMILLFIYRVVVGNKRFA